MFYERLKKDYSNLLNVFMEKQFLRQQRREYFDFGRMVINGKG